MVLSRDVWRVMCLYKFFEALQAEQSVQETRMTEIEASIYHLLLLIPILIRLKSGHSKSGYFHPDLVSYGLCIFRKRKHPDFFTEHLAPVALGSAILKGILVFECFFGCSY